MIILAIIVVILTMIGVYTALYGFYILTMVRCDANIYAARSDMSNVLLKQMINTKLIWRRRFITVAYCLTAFWIALYCAIYVYVRNS